MKRIKSYKLFESTQSVEEICQKYRILNWTINEDGTVDVDGNVDLYKRGLSKLPLKFGRVTGYFNCCDNELTSLVGSPNWVGGNFNCSYNKLTNLIGGPNFVDGSFDCSNNKLTNLEGCPEKIFGSLHCQSNEIHSLDHYPTILTGRLFTYGTPIDEIWIIVFDHKPNNHGYYLHLFDLHYPIQFDGGEWVCYREFLDNFFEETGLPKSKLPKLKNYKEV